MRASLFPILLLGMMLSGCANNATWHEARFPGLIYEHTRVPLTLDMNATPAANNEGSPRHIHKIEIQGIQALSGDNSIGGIAKASGLETVYYADVETLRILFYQRTTVHVYGAPASAE